MDHNLNLFLKTEKKEVHEDQEKTRQLNQLQLFNQQEQQLDLQGRQVDLPQDKVKVQSKS